MHILGGLHQGHEHIEFIFLDRIEFGANETVYLPKCSAAWSTSRR
ncbi:MAG TPA: hypothetical protein VIR34_04060 [Gemmatimonadaceae bacterium]|jgi:hypothetical protein